MVMTSLGRGDVWGTSDAVFIGVVNAAVEIVDYKNGYDPVDPVDNPQLIGYAIATLDTFKLWSGVGYVKTTIVQPNNNHIEGPIRYHVYSIDEMKRWQLKFAAMVQRADDINETPVAGDHCKWCPARDNCRAHWEWVMEMVTTEKPLKELTPQELEYIYRHKSHITSWLSQIDNRILSMALNGAKFDGLKVVNSYSRAKCIDEDGLVQTAVMMGVDKFSMFKTELKSKTDLKRLIPETVIKQYFITPEPGRKLVPMDDKSPAVRIESKIDAFKAFAIKE